MALRQCIRQLQQTNGLTFRDLAPLVGVGFAYLSRVENCRLNYGDYPSEALILRLSEALDADEDELLLLAEKISEQVRVRVFQRTDAFSAFVAYDDDTLDKLMVEVGQIPTKP